MSDTERWSWHRGGRIGRADSDQTGGCEERQSVLVPWRKSGDRAPVHQPDPMAVLYQPGGKGQTDTAQATGDGDRLGWFRSVERLQPGLAPSQVDDVTIVRAAAAGRAAQLLAYSQLRMFGGSGSQQARPTCSSVSQGEESILCEGLSYGGQQEGGIASAPVSPESDDDLAVPAFQPRRSCGRNLIGRMVVRIDRNEGEIRCADE